MCERQTQGGGLNGRPEKLPDVRPPLHAACSRPCKHLQGPCICSTAIPSGCLDVMRACTGIGTFQTALQRRVCGRTAKRERVCVRVSPSMRACVCAGVLFLVVSLCPQHLGPSALDRSDRPAQLHPRRSGDPAGYLACISCCMCACPHRRKCFFNALQDQLGHVTSMPECLKMLDYATPKH